LSGQKFPKIIPDILFLPALRVYAFLGLRHIFSLIQIGVKDG
jgi:hypothetical protein